MDKNTYELNSLNTFVLYPVLPHHSAINPPARLQEAIGLAKAIDLTVIESDYVILKKIRPNYLIGQGTVDRIQECVSSQNIKLVVIDTTLSPVQQRNLEKIWACKVIDRTGLILEIFGARARTKEGSLQVELATLDYQKSRLVKSWSHLERQRGGLSSTGGPGETQLETDRRLISDRIVKLKVALEKVKMRRSTQRRARQKVPFPIVALVGYTNAGKSTLFNTLTQANVFVQDLLFATLDPTMRQIKLPSGQKIILSDTVGFISDLPTQLIAAFQATLEEVQTADVILHIQDLSHPDHVNQANSVEAVLNDLGVDPARFNVLNVLNKIDQIDPDSLINSNVMVQHDGTRKTYLISALKNSGIQEMLLAVDTVLSCQHQRYEFKLNPTDSKLGSWLYAHGKVIHDHFDDQGYHHMQVLLSLEQYSRYQNLITASQNH